MPRKILIVDDLATNRIILKVKLHAACHDTLQASTGETAIQIARDEQPKLILLDMMLPDISGIEVCKRLRADPQTKHIPIVVITASFERESRLAALEAGANEFLTKPLNEVILLARIRSLLRAEETEAELRMRSETWGDFELAEEAPVFSMPARIGLVAADTATAIAWRTALAPHFEERLSVLSPNAALAATQTGQEPDLYMIAANLGAFGTGLGLLSDLRSREQGRHAAIALVVPNAAAETAAMALDLGANDLLTLPLDAEETAIRLKLHVERKRRADRLRQTVNHGLRLAVTDPLTGLYNRRYAMAHLERIADRAHDTRRNFAVLALDLDHFKRINDTYGHASGDAVLMSVADRLTRNLRPNDLVARIGGEEFLVVLPDISLGDAQATAQRLCQAIAMDPVALAEGKGQTRITVSVGLCLGPVFKHDVSTERKRGEVALSCADEALLEAKMHGRNQVTVADAA